MHRVGHVGAITVVASGSLSTVISPMLTHLLTPSLTWLPAPALRKKNEEGGITLTDFILNYKVTNNQISVVLA